MLHCPSPNLRNLLNENRQLFFVLTALFVQSAGFLNKVRRGHSHPKKESKEVLAAICCCDPSGGNADRDGNTGKQYRAKPAQRLFEVLTENVGIAPAWQVQTQLGNMQQMLA